MIRNLHYVLLSLLFFNTNKVNWLFFCFFFLFFFAVWLTDKRREALFPARTIVRDPHHRESPRWLQAGFEHVQNLSSGLVKWSCAVVITTIPQHHMLISSAKTRHHLLISSVKALCLSLLNFCCVFDINLFFMNFPFSFLKEGK